MRELPAGEIDDMLRERVPIDLQLLLGGLLLGTLARRRGGRCCAMRPRSLLARVLHVATALLLSCPPYFLAFMVLIWFSWNIGDFPAAVRLRPGRLRAVQRGPAAVPEGDVGAVGAGALPLAAFVAADRRGKLREALQEDFVRTARAKGLPTAAWSTATRSRSPRPRSPR